MKVAGLAAVLGSGVAAGVSAQPGTDPIPRAKPAPAPSEQVGTSGSSIADIARMPGQFEAFLRNMPRFGTGSNVTPHHEISVVPMLVRSGQGSAQGLIISFSLPSADMATPYLTVTVDSDEIEPLMAFLAQPAVAPPAAGDVPAGKAVHRSIFHLQSGADFLREPSSIGTPIFTVILDFFRNGVRDRRTDPNVLVQGEDIGRFIAALRAGRDGLQGLGTD
jgi:hypothetical protein